MPLPHVSAGGQGPDTTATLRREAQGLLLSGASALTGRAPAGLLTGQQEEAKEGETWFYRFLGSSLPLQL